MWPNYRLVDLQCTALIRYRNQHFTTCAGGAFYGHCAVEGFDPV
jgi:hypothetical protein